VFVRACVCVCVRVCVCVCVCVRGTDAKSVVVGAGKGPCQKSDAVLFECVSPDDVHQNALARSHAQVHLTCARVRSTFTFLREWCEKVAREKVARESDVHALGVQ
jgi:hypothetical protein